ncbi:hypothetical protein BLA29_010804 [Euroglyphus maynei]|uniref:Uncharacterized protein n=1 Tax=Euroglyphus maynei TaxID=6958 RepID=A0A1Y3AQ74_EURMA|nr:hypothetical protein BLA29_010804 [Euroglyphus maynei]
MTGICHSTPMKNSDINDDNEKVEFNSDNESESTLSNCESPPSSYPSSPVNEFDGTPRSNDTILDLNTVCAVLKENLLI